MTSLRRWGGGLFASGAVGLLVGPVVAIALLSLSPSAALEFYRQPAGASLEWWWHPFADHTWAIALGTSLLAGSMASMFTIAVVVPAACAWRLNDSSFGRTALVLTLLAWLISPVSLAAGASRTVTLLGLFDSIPGLALSHVAVVLPAASLVCLSRFGQSGVAEFHSARVLGATPFTAAVTWLLVRHRVTIPAAFIVGLMTSMAEATITLFVTDLRTLTITRRALAGTNFSVEPSVFAVMTIWLACAYAIAYLVTRGEVDHDARSTHR